MSQTGRRCRRRRRRHRPRRWSLRYETHSRWIRWIHKRLGWSLLLCLGCDVCISLALSARVNRGQRSCYCPLWGDAGNVFTQVRLTVSDLATDRTLSTRLVLFAKKKRGLSSSTPWFTCKSSHLSQNSSKQLCKNCEKKLFHINSQCAPKMHRPFGIV